MKIFQKYGELALSLGLIEVGLLSQGIHLISNELGFGTCDIGGFDKVSGEKILNLDGINDHLVYAIVSGKKEV